MAKGTIRVVDDIDAAAEEIRAEQNGEPAQTPKHAAKAESAVSGVAALLGRETYTWTSPWNPGVVVKFRRPRAGADELVARLLGDQEANVTLQRRYKALIAVTECNGKQYTQVKTETQLRVIRDHIGFVGPEDDDVFDEVVNAYTTAYEMAMYPEQIRAISEAQGVGLSNEDISRIAKATGLERPKA